MEDTAIFMDDGSGSAALSNNGLISTGADQGERGVIIHLRTTTVTVTNNGEIRTRKEGIYVSIDTGEDIRIKNNGMIESFEKEAI